MRVELPNVGAAKRDQRRLTIRAGGPPVLDESLDEGPSIAADDQALVCFVYADGFTGDSLAQRVEGVALPFLPLTAVVGQLDRVGPGDDGAEGAAGADRGQLAVVAAEHELSARFDDVVDELCEARDETIDASSSTTTVPGASAKFAPRRSSRRSAARLVLGMPALCWSSRAARRATADTDHTQPRGSPRLAGGTQRGRLAGPRLAHHGDDLTAVAREPTHHRLLLCSQERPPLEGRLDRFRSRNPNPEASIAHGDVHDPLLDREQIRR
jgi:hypothetical protein